MWENNHGEKGWSSGYHHHILPEHLFEGSAIHWAERADGCQLQRLARLAEPRRLVNVAIGNAVCLWWIVAVAANMHWHVAAPALAKLIFLYAAAG